MASDGRINLILLGLLVVVAGAIGGVFLILESEADDPLALALDCGDEFEGDETGASANGDEARIQKLEARVVAHLRKTGPDDSAEAVLSGLVLTAAGLPAAGATVRATQDGEEIDIPAYRGDLAEFEAEVEAFLAAPTPTVSQAKTNDKGEFRFDRLEQDLTYSLLATSAEGREAELANVTAGGEPVTIRLPERVLSVTVIIVASAGELPSTLEVSASPVGLSVSPVTRKLENSSELRLTLPVEGKWSIAVKAKGFYQPKAVIAEVSETTADVKIVLDPGAMLSGRVMDSEGHSLDGAEVTISAPGAVAVPPATTDLRGNYEFDSLRPGMYAATIRYGDNQSSESILVILGENDEDLTVGLGSVLTVNVQDSNGSPVSIPDEKQLFRLLLTTGVESRAVRTITRLGVVEYRGVKAGHYRLWSSIRGYASRSDYIRVKGDETEFTIKLRRGGSIVGSVSFSDNSSVKGVVYIQARPAPRVRDRVRTVYPDEHGDFEIESLPVGTWVVHVYSLSPRRSIHSQTIEVIEGTNTFDAVLDVGGRLSVTVKNDKGGLHSSRVSVRLTDSKGKSVVATTDTASVANFAFLEPGEYRVTVRTWGRSALFSSTETVQVRNGTQSSTVTLHAANCLRITSVESGSNSGNCGMQTGDYIFEFNGARCSSLSELIAAIKTARTDRSVSMQVIRGGLRLTLTVSSWQGAKLGVNAVPDRVSSLN